MNITGSHFISTSVANWNDSVLPTVYVNDSTLSVTVSNRLIAFPGTDTITVINEGPGGGTSNKVVFTCTSNQTNPIATLSTLSPSNILVGSANFTLTVNGSNFLSGSKINWNNNPLSTTWISASQLTATISASLIDTAGSATIFVNNPSPGGGNSNNLTFTITALTNNPIPTLTSISPSAATAGASSFTLTATGTNFTSTSKINWNGSPQTTTYISNTQISTTISNTLLTTAGSANVTIFNPTPGGGTSVAKTFTINAASTTKKFLFDAKKGETVGNADWVIDQDNTPQRIPTPAQSTITSSTLETYWSGALSSWGIALVKLGHTVETLPSSGSITYNNSSNAQDLSNYDVFVVDEPNIKFTTTEMQAIINFVSNGGGLFMIADHINSDRNFDGWDSPKIWNDLMANNGIDADPFGFIIDSSSVNLTSTNVLTGNSTNTILHGSQGNVTQLDISDGATLTLNTTANPSVKGLIWRNGYAQSNTQVLCASATYGTGRVVVITDSSPMDDGTTTSGDTVYVDWPLYSHIPLIMNASLWLAKIQ